MSTPDQTRIVNAALAELGSSDRIISIDDPRSVAQRAKALWDDVVRDVLSEHPWNFAIRRARLNAQAGNALSGDRYAWRYQLPGDCVRWLPWAGSDADWFHGEREGNAIVTDRADGITIRFVAAIDDVGQWPPKFATAVTLKLAAAMAEGVTQSEGIKDRMEERARDALRRAKRVDGLETGAVQRPAAHASSEWLNARGRRYSSRGMRW